MEGIGGNFIGWIYDGCVVEEIIGVGDEEGEVVDWGGVVGVRGCVVRESLWD